jgi:glycosyltransferase involved in cell wall biosynthesis/3-hydroxymyristoyl/3-hydroxydecanoyl-(acyl carrier protein) dehydratase
MKLLNDFFSIKERTGNESEWVYHLSLNAGHPIYQAHFQGNPITPGACIIQMLKERIQVHFSTSECYIAHRHCEERSNPDNLIALDCFVPRNDVKQHYFIRNVKNVKFLIAINPTEHATIDVHFTTKVEENDALAIAAVIKNAQTVFCKANLLLTPVEAGQKPALQERFEQCRLCVVIPTYNNEKTLVQVINDVLSYTNSVIVVNDGATDSTNELLKNFDGKIEVVSYEENKGKGYALKCGFDRAEELGYEAAITLDSDGQHYASDIETFVKMAEANPCAFLIGQRIIEGLIPSGNSFANRFSNFWFAVHTGRRLKDTQNGFRLYPLAAMKGLRPLSARYEAELEMLVRSAWKGIAIRPVPVHVYYPPEGERVTHFKPGKDFVRISLLNTLFTFLAILYGYPSMLCCWVKSFRPLNKLFKKS